MSNSDFLSLAAKIGQLLQAYDHFAAQAFERHKDDSVACLDATTEYWRLTKFYIKGHLDRAPITPKEFDAQLKRIAPRKRLVKMERLFQVVT